MVSKILNLNKFIVLLHSKRYTATPTTFFAKYLRFFLLTASVLFVFFRFRFAFVSVRSVSVLGINSIVLMSHFNVGVAPQTRSQHELLCTALQKHMHLHLQKVHFVSFLHDQLQLDPLQLSFDPELDA